MIAIANVIFITLFLRRTHAVAAVEYSLPEVPGIERRLQRQPERLDGRRREEK
jgi:hypothetical protein